MATPAEELRDALAKPEKPKRTAWDIGADLEALGDRIAEAGGEITPEVEAAMEALDGGEFIPKLERIYLYAKDCELDAEKAGQWKDHYAETQAYYQRKAKGLKGLLLALMQRFGRDKVQTPRAKFSRVQSPPSYRWSGDNYEDIPAMFRRTRIVHTLDVDAVKRAIAEGVAIPQEIVSERGWHLR